MGNFGKDTFHFWNDSRKKEVQIFEDACDSGVILTEQNKSVYRQWWKDMLDTFDVKKTVWGTKEQGGQSIEFMAPIEEDEGLYCGYSIKVSYIQTKVHKFNKTIPTEFITVDFIESKRQTKDPFKKGQK